MTRSFAPTVSLTARPLMWAAVALMFVAISGGEVAAQSSTRNRLTADPDFGPAPFGDDTEFEQPSYSGRTNSYRLNDGSLPSSRSRDPATQKRFEQLFQEEGDYRPQPDDLPTRGYRQGYRSEYRPNPLDQKWNLEDLPLPTRARPTQIPIETSPVKKAPAQPSLSEKIAKRYQDPRVIRIVQQLNQQSGEALYAEVSQLIDSRHITPTSYQQRVESGLEHLAMAVQTPAFQQAAGANPNPQAVRSLQQQLQNMAYQTNVQSLSQAVAVIRQAGQMTSHTLNVNPSVVTLEFVYGALDTLDQFSMFIAPEKTGNTSLGLKENMVGIGVEIESHPQGLKILKALTGGPAAQATLKRGDIITAVDGRPVAGLELTEAADLISGPSNSPVQLSLKRASMIGDVTLVRRQFAVHSVSEVRMEQANVGYIKLDQFAEATSKEMDDALWKLHEQGMQSLILDLRGNPGGLLTTAIELSDKFLPSGTIVSTRGRTANDNSQETAQYAQTWKTPLVVLIDHNSASASEIFAAAIQENGRGVVVGEKSYGKGTVQTLFPLQSVSSALRLTTAKFYSPDGREMAGVGVTPDIKITTNINDTTGADAALQAAVRAAKDPNVMNMAGTRPTGKSAIRVIRVVT
jgi:carboxyl-terminal processing protease